MKIAIITGSYPPDACGIGDYTFQLAQSLTAGGATVEVFHKFSWRTANIGRVLSAIRSAAPDVVHIQYPTAGFGWNLLPQLLSLVAPGVVTLHEISQAHILRRLSLYPFSLRSRHIVFTTPFEREYFSRWAPWIGGRSSVIPVGSSIRTANAPSERSLDTIVYFGFFRPQKGIEDVLALASLIRKKGLGMQVRMIGKPFPEGSPYYTELRKAAADLPVQWNVDLEEDAVANALSGCAVGYMPFPDGASGRRTSLLAMMANGVAMITTQGAHTPPDLGDAVLFAEGPEGALELIERIRRDTDLRIRLSRNGRAYADRFSWPAIAQQHLGIYERLLRGQKKVSRQ